MASDTDLTENGAGAEDAAPKRPSATRVEHFTPAERAARGKATRAEVSRASHGEWEPALHRPDPVELLEEQAQTRVPELVPIRYGRMLVSPFTFYRGAAYLMASDLAAGPRTGLHTQLCGDAHLSNFGGFAAPDRQHRLQPQRLRRDAPRPVRVGRQAARRELRRRRARSRLRREAARRDQPGGRPRRTARASARSPRCATSTSGTRGIDIDDLLATRRAGEPDAKDAKAEKRLEANVAKGRTKDSMKAFGKLTEVVDGELRIVGDPPLIVPIEDVHAEHVDQMEEFLRGVIRSYRRTLAGDRRKLLERFRYVHAARKVVGVGSVGTRAWICLMLGRDDQDPLFLQFKEAQPSVLEPFLGRSEYANSGQRVVEGQRLTQAASDIMLGWIKVDAPDGVKRDFYVRQLWDAKMSALVEFMEPRAMGVYAQRLRTRARPRPRARRRRHRDRELPRQRRHLRPGDRPVRGVLRRPERA